MVRFYCIIRVIKLNLIASNRLIVNDYFELVVTGVRKPIKTEDKENFGLLCLQELQRLHSSLNGLDWPSKFHCRSSLRLHWTNVQWTHHQSLKYFQYFSILALQLPELVQKRRPHTCQENKSLWFALPTLMTLLCPRWNCGLTHESPFFGFQPFS